MNRAPFGGALALEFTPPAVALTTSIALKALQWADDDPNDLPLSYSFGYKPQGAQGAAVAPTAFRASGAWCLRRRGFRWSGNWTLAVRVSDVFDASATASQSLSVDPVVLDAAKADRFLRWRQAHCDGRRQCEHRPRRLARGCTQPAEGSRAESAGTGRLHGDADGTHSTVNATLNATAVAEEAARQAKLRGSIMDVISDSAGAAASDADAIGQAVGAVDSLVSGDCEGAALDKGADVLSTMVAGAQGEGGLADGTSGQDGIRDWLDAVARRHASQEGSRHPRWRRLRELAETAETGTSNASALARSGGAGQGAGQGACR